MKCQRQNSNSGSRKKPSVIVYHETRFKTMYARIHNSLRRPTLFSSLRRQPPMYIRYDVTAGMMLCMGTLM